MPTPPQAASSPAVVVFPQKVVERLIVVQPEVPRTEPLEAVAPPTLARVEPEKVYVVLSPEVQMITRPEAKAEILSIPLEQRTFAVQRKPEAKKRQAEIKSSAPEEKMSVLEIKSSGNKRKPEVLLPEKLKTYGGTGRRHTDAQIDEILDWYIESSQLPSYVSDRQRRYYKAHPRLADRRRLKNGYSN